jgi:drug/metabolite transporter (DMT)-like permease
VIFRRDLAALVDPHYVQGLAAVLLASLVWSSGAVLQKRVSAPGSPLATAAAQMIFVGCVLSVLGLAVGEAPHFRPTAASLAGLAYLVAFGSIVGYGCFVYALSRLDAGFVASYAYINPLVAILLGWGVLGERVDWSLAVAAALIVSGVALIQAPAWRRLVRRFVDTADEATAAAAEGTTSRAEGRSREESSPKARPPKAARAGR